MPDDARNLYFIGPMGSGKTTIGKRVAGRLGRPFLDCDQELVRRTGAEISLIFDIEGEAGFRQREKNLLAELAQRRGWVIATGGGTVLDPDNRRLMTSSGLIIWLNAPVGQQLERLDRDRQRPLLAAPDREDRLESMADQRNPLYRALAHIEVPSEARSLRYMTARVLKALDAYNRQRAAS